MKKTLIAIALLASSSAQAAVISGATVDYIIDETLLGLFGPASVDVGTDILRFDPTAAGWVASAKGPGFDVNDANDTITFKVVAKSGYTLSSVSVAERGDYKAWGLTTRDPEALALAAVAGEVVVNQFQDHDLQVAYQYTDGSLNFAPQQYDPVVLTQQGSNPFPLLNWTASVQNIPLFGFESLLTLQNVLTALADGKAQAFIEKKAVQVSVSTTFVPLPASIWVLGSALMGMVAIGRRKLEGSAA